MERTYIKDLHEHVSKEVKIKGWVHVRRDHGKLIFIDLRDMTGLVQMVALPNHEDARSIANTLRNEWVISVTGLVNKRPDKMVQADQPNGDIEIEITDIEVLNDAETLPFDITNDTQDIDENVRLQYRYLDLRSERMQKNIRLRSKFIQTAREFLFKNQFTEIETPLLTESTPEGSRDFVVPSRLHKGLFYALPQSPQQYKQLLMTGGFERYFQIARAIRDEDLRADRGFEHTQIDIEMSFVKQEDVLNMIESMMIHTVEKMGFTIKEKPFPRISYKEALEKYGADKFDLRTEKEKEAGVLAYAWVVDFPFFEKTEEGGWTFSHNPFSMPKDEYIYDLLNGKNIENILTTQYDLVCNGYESGGGSVRAHRRDLLEATYKIMGYSSEEMIDSVGHMLDAFTYGTPPHGGIALGVERNIMNLTGEVSLREVQAFPMTRGGQTAVMNAPKPLAQKQLTELGIEIKKK
ncbi:aspartate--tRNA ligase [Candidatus Campbellbacteria bacterium CG22_combo_CG10-13_8_21_14_all_36_13]|uniref:Aspartate--tRNA ligase n=1 Tax=Candidatus Campbellbacteria bacterium CG22_combo_CG10-13_8_21_14_all_36_13 TaxID=1974529 RepID=A0A2H0DXF5_9BACT|nr:MAG: aspartate--tRNA ligase [Candidatus Campbellbacteria bacterium CG22_combo_CG10-13_8_21_14_all_36_13]